MPSTIACVASQAEKRLTILFITRHILNWCTDWLIKVLRRNRWYRIRSFSWFSTEETKSNTTKWSTLKQKSTQKAKPKQTHKMLNLNLNQHSTLRNTHMCVCVSLCTTVLHNTAQNFWYLSSYLPDNCHYSDAVYCRGGGNHLRHNGFRPRILWWPICVVYKAKALHYLT